MSRLVYVKLHQMSCTSKKHKQMFDFLIDFLEGPDYNISIEIKSNKMGTEDRNTLIVVAVFAVLLAVVFGFFIKLIAVTGDSMNETLQTGNG